MKETAIGASEFKAKCLRLFDDVAQDHESFVITKRGKPVARVIPMESDEPKALPPMRGDWQGRGEILGDIVYFDGADDWEALK